MVTVSDPFTGLSDLQLGDEKVNLNHLVDVCVCFFFLGIFVVGWEYFCTICFSDNFVGMNKSLGFSECWYVFMVLCCYCMICL